jgi:hypothetical protein
LFDIFLPPPPQQLKLSLATQIDFLPPRPMCYTNETWQLEYLIINQLAGNYSRGRMIIPVAECARLARLVDERLVDRASQWKMVALVEAMDVFPIKSLVSNLHPSTEGSNCRKILNREPDRLSGRRKTTTYESRTRSTLTLCHEQFGWQSVVKGHHLFVQAER